ncbi:MAG: tyrosine-type recombinase/integrase [Candidatus Pacearchaeota archaeon]
MYKERYERRKEELLNNKDINPKNRQVTEKFLEFEQYKLKRKQGLAEVDEKSYKTLYFYIGRLINLNNWFKNKDWSKLTEVEIKKLIDDLEDGNIKTQNGTRFADRSLYYQMMKGKLFDLVGKSFIATQIIKEFSIKGREFRDEVRYIEEESFRKIVDCAPKTEHKCLMWLAFDIGENIGTLLELTREDFQRQINPDTNEPEYLVMLTKDRIKRSRTARGETTNYQETVKYLEIVLRNLKPADPKNVKNRYLKSKKTLNELHPENKLFKFGHKAAVKFFDRAVERAGVKCLPGGQKVTFKDLRSSMACDLLRKGWSREECNSRLGHKPSSRTIDSYINYLSLDRRKPQKKVYESNLKKIEADFEKQKEVSKLQGLKIENLKEDITQIKTDFKLAMEKQRKQLIEIVMELKKGQTKPLVVKSS